MKSLKSKLAMLAIMLICAIHDAIDIVKHYLVFFGSTGNFIPARWPALADIELIHGQIDVELHLTKLDFGNRLFAIRMRKADPDSRQFEVMMHKLIVQAVTQGYRNIRAIQVGTALYQVDYETMLMDRLVINTAYRELRSTKSIASNLGMQIH